MILVCVDLKIIFFKREIIYLFFLEKREKTLGAHVTEVCVGFVCLLLLGFLLLLFFLGGFLFGGGGGLQDMIE